MLYISSAPLHFCMLIYVHIWTTDCVAGVDTALHDFLLYGSSVQFFRAVMLKFKQKVKVGKEDTFSKHVTYMNDIHPSTHGHLQLGFTNTRSHTVSSPVNVDVTTVFVPSLHTATHVLTGATFYSLLIVIITSVYSLFHRARLPLSVWFVTNNKYESSLLCTYDKLITTLLAHTAGRHLDTTLLCN